MLGRFNPMLGQIWTNPKYMKINCQLRQKVEKKYQVKNTFV